MIIFYFMENNLPELSVFDGEFVDALWCELVANLDYVFVLILAILDDHLY